MLSPIITYASRSFEVLGTDLIDCNLVFVQALSHAFTKSLGTANVIPRIGIGFDAFGDRFCSALTIGSNL